MKSIKFLMAISLVGACVFSSCNCKYNSGDRLPETTKSEIDSVSYALGAHFGIMIANSDFGELNKCQIEKGMSDVIGGKELKISEQDLVQTIQQFLMARMDAKAQIALAEGVEFLEKKKSEKGVVATESGLAYKIIEQGAGAAPKLTDTVEVHYKGTLISGEEFDSSYKREEPAKFPLGQVIKGWSEGITYVNEGGKIELYIPSELAYGPRQAGSIPANSTLIFEVELLKVYPGPEVEE